MAYFFTRKYKGRPLWSQGAFRLYAATCLSLSLPTPRRIVQEVCLLVLICSVDKMVMKVEWKVLPASSQLASKL